MSRPEKPFPANAPGPLVEFAAGLRALRSQAGMTYRELAAITHYSVTTLSQAAAGSRLPDRQVALAYAAACDSDTAEWAVRWDDTKAALGQLDKAPPQPVMSTDQAAAVPTGPAAADTTHPRDRSGITAKPRRPDPAGSSFPGPRAEHREPVVRGLARDLYSSMMALDVTHVRAPVSSPALVTTPADLTRALQQQRARIGNPSYREINRRTRAQGDEVPTSTIQAVFTHADRLPTGRVMKAILAALDVPEDKMQVWSDAWARSRNVSKTAEPELLSRRWRWSPPIRLAAYTVLLLMLISQVILVTITILR